MNDVNTLHLWQLGSAYVFILIILFFIKIRKIPREKELLISTVRMTLQLILVGHLLVYVFSNASPWYTLLALVLMESFAIHNVFSRVKGRVSKKLKKIIALSMLFGTISSIGYFIVIVMSIDPWYDPRYFIPISGMLIGNSMTGICLGVSRLVEGMKDQSHMIESSLMLGATPKVASKKVVDSAFDAAILPSLNSMVGMGIVFLPGMMTGQILSGTSPVTAIQYQIVIMLGIVGSVTLTIMLFVLLGYKTFFNAQDQLTFD